MLNAKTDQERADIAARMTNRELFDAAFSVLAQWQAELDSSAKAHTLRMAYLALRLELEKRLTRTGFLPTREAQE